MLDAEDILSVLALALTVSEVEVLADILIDDAADTDAVDDELTSKIDDEVVDELVSAAAMLEVTEGASKAALEDTMAIDLRPVQT